MKKVYPLSILFFVCVNTSIYADIGNVDDLARKYLIMLGYKEIHEERIDVLITGIVKSIKTTPEKLSRGNNNNDISEIELNKLRAVLQSALQWESLEKRFIKLIKDVYNEEELIYVIGMLESNVGNLYVTKNNNLNLKFSEIDEALSHSFLNRMASMGGKGGAYR